MDLTTKDIAKATKNAVSELCDIINNKKDECDNNNITLPYGFISKHLIAVKSVCPFISRHDVNNELRRRSKRGNRSLETDFTRCWNQQRSQMQSKVQCKFHKIISGCIA